MRISHRNAGFSMIELLVVMVILGLLAGLVGPRLFDRADIAKVQTAETQMAMLKGSLTLFRLDIGRYPTAEEGLNALVRQPGNEKTWQGPYLDEAVPVDPWGNRYQYLYKRSGFQDFSLFSYGADGVKNGEGLNADVGFLPDE
jgi:general secretion pathway protein G